MCDNTYGPETTPGGAWNKVFEALGSLARRTLIRSLSEVRPGEGVSLPEGARFADAGPPVDRLELDLRHKHLPKLTAAGYVDWVEDPFRAYRGARFDRPAEVLRVIDDHRSELPTTLVDGIDGTEGVDSGRF
jgi:hypothetical protein